MYYLLMLTHNDTGLKYLCKTTRDDWHKYYGSGVYWRAHLKKHGKNVKHQLIFQTEDFDLFKSVCIGSSALLDVVESEDWANLTEERGDNGIPGDLNPSKRPEVQEKQRRALKGNKNGAGNNNQIGNKWNLGKKRSAQAKALMSARKKGRSWHKDPETGKRVWV